MRTMRPMSNLPKEAGPYRKDKLKRYMRATKRCVALYQNGRCQGIEAADALRELRAASAALSPGETKLVQIWRKKTYGTRV